MSLPHRPTGKCGLRDYGTPGQLGLEKTPAEYVANLVAVFREVRRVLRDDGVLWLNLGDSYVTGTTAERQFGTLDFGQGTMKARQIARNGTPPGLKPKDLVGIPWRVAFALQDDGWWLRSDIIWAKPNPMPESVTDRPTKAHEYIFLLAKSQRYFWDAEAVKEETTDPEYRERGKIRPTQDNRAGFEIRGGLHNQVGGRTSRNLRSVWHIATHPYSGAHFATFPPALVEPMVKASTSERGCCPKCGKAWERVVERHGDAPGVVRIRNVGGRSDGLTRAATSFGNPPTPTTTGFRPGCACYPRTEEWREYITAKPGKELTPEQEAENERIRAIRAELLACWQPLEAQPCLVLDPFGGAGTTGLVASRLGRDAVLIELNPEYAEMARKRIRDDAPLLNGGME